MITIQNINSKWDEIKGKLNPNTVKMATANGFLETAEVFEEYKDFLDDEAKGLLNTFISLVNKELEASSKEATPQKEKSPKAAKEPKATKTPKTPKAPKTSKKKEFSGEYVEKISEEVRFIKRYASLNGKKVSSVKEKARSILSSLQKSIVEKRIRKTSKYADEIMNIQRNLIRILNTSGDATLNFTNIENLEKIYKNYKIAPDAKFIKQYLSIQGKSGVKEKAKTLQKSIEKSDFNGNLSNEIDAIKKSIKNYLEDKTDTPEISAQTLAGLYGVAGLSMKGCKSGSAVGSTEFLSKKFKILSLSGKFGNLIGQPSEPFKIMIYGKAGSGKSSLSLQLAQYLAELGKKVLYVADEEKFGYTLQEKMRRFNIHHRNLFVVDTMPKNFDGYDVVFIDSVNSAGYEPEDLRKLDSSKSYVYVFQCTKEGNFRGSQEFEHDVDTSIVVEDMKAHAVKNRFGGNGEISVR